MRFPSHTLACILSLAVALPVVTGPLTATAQSRAPVRESDILKNSSLLDLPAAELTPGPSESTVFYAVDGAVAFASADSTHPYMDLDAREPVRMVRSGPSWAEIQTADGARGYVRKEVLSDVWIRVSKKLRTVWVHRGADIAVTVPADMANNFFLDKEQRGSPSMADHWRTPEGLYYVVSKNDQSRFHKAFVLNYPSRKDAEAGLAEGVISNSQFTAIVEADRTFEMPPMDTPLGGWIEIHGMGTGSRTTWTRGCVAIPNESMDAIWDLVHVGTPVLIES